MLDVMVLLTISNLIAVPINHEIGHYLVHLWFNRKPKFHFTGVTFNLEPYNRFQLDLATFSGIFFGLIAFIPLLDIDRNMFYVILVFYIYSCRDDLLQFFREYKNINEVSHD